MTTAADAAAPLVADLRAIFGARLRAVVAYGACLDGLPGAPVTCLALADTLTADDLDACARASAAWERRGVAVPLLLARGEFARALDAFPLEYGEIIRAHALLYGEDPFAGAAIDPADTRRACEVESRSHLLHLRESYVECGGRPKEIAALVAAAAPGLAALLRNLARLAGREAADAQALTRAGAEAAGLDAAVTGSILALAFPSAAAPTDPARLFPAYLAAVEQLVRTVDDWRA